MTENVVIAIISSATTLIIALLGFWQATKGKKNIRKERTDLMTHPLFHELKAVRQFFKFNYKHVDKGRENLARELVINMIDRWEVILLELAEFASAVFNISSYI